MSQFKRGITVFPIPKKRLVVALAVALVSFSVVPVANAQQEVYTVSQDNSLSPPLPPDFESFRNDPSVSEIQFAPGFYDPGYSGHTPFYLSAVLTISNGSNERNGAPLTLIGPKPQGATFTVDTGSGLQIIKSEGVLNLENLGFTGAEAGAVSATSGGIKDSSFYGNSSKGNGGAVSYTNPGLYDDSITGTIFKNNKATSGSGSASGGAIYFSRGVGQNGTISDTSFLDNAVQGRGGAIYVNGDFKGTIDGTTQFVKNTAEFGSVLFLSGFGGALYAAANIGGNIGGIFSENKAGDDGGALYAGGNIDSNITADFSLNEAGRNGGALYATKNIGDTIGGRFSKNKAGNDGGALYADAAFNANVTGSFTDNEAGNSGGAIYARSLDADFSRAFFDGNKALNGDGGAIYSGGDVDIDASSGYLEFSGNQAKGNGGAIYVGKDATLNASGGNIRFQYNQANGADNALYMANTGTDNTLTLNAHHGFSINFADPIASSSADPLQIIVFNDSSATNTGTIVFESSLPSEVYFEEADLQQGTLVLRNGTTLGAAGNVGAAYTSKFVQKAGATLEIDTGDHSKYSTLNVDKATFEGTLFFKLPKDIANGDTMLKVAGDANIDNTASVLLAFQGSTSLQETQYINLIDAANPVDTKLNATQTAQIGALGLRDVHVYKHQNGNLVAEVLPLSVPPAVVSPSVTPGLVDGADTVGAAYLSGLTTAMRGIELVTMADKGIDRARDAQEAREGYHPLALFTGGKDRYITGSHLSQEGYNLVTGLTWQANWGGDFFMLGAFFDYGMSHYRTTADGKNGLIHGDGRTDYIGGGVMGHLDFLTSESGHFYTEGVLRAGRLNVDFQSNELLDSTTGQRLEFDTKSSFLNAMLGLGYVWEPSDNDLINVYSKAFWAHQGSDDVLTVTSEAIDFDAVNSMRLRLGVRYTRLFESKGSHVFVGAAYDHEFDGEVVATVHGATLKKPDLKGGTGMAELGLVFSDMFDLPLTYEFGLHGYFGKHEGVLGTFRIQYVF